MLPIIPIIGCAIGGLFTAAAIDVATDDDSDSYDDEDSYSSSDFVERMRVAREAKRREREVKARRRQAALREAEKDLARITSRGKKCIVAAKTKAEQCRRKAAEVAAIEHDMNEFFEENA